MCSLFGTDLLLCSGIPTKWDMNRQKRHQCSPFYPQYLKQFLTHMRHSANTRHIYTEWTNEQTWVNLMNSTPVRWIKSFRGHRSSFFLGRYVGIELPDRLSVMSNLKGKNLPNCFLNGFQNTCTILHSHGNMREFQFFHIPPNIWYHQSWLSVAILWGRPDISLWFQFAFL